MDEFLRDKGLLGPKVESDELAATARRADISARTLSDEINERRMRCCVHGAS